MSTNNYEDWANQPVYFRMPLYNSLLQVEQRAIEDFVRTRMVHYYQQHYWESFFFNNHMPNQNNNNAGAEREMTATERLQEEARRARRWRERQDRERGRPFLANQPTADELDRIFGTRATPITPIPRPPHPPPAAAQFIPPPATAPTPGEWVIRNDMDPRAPAVVVDDWEIDVGSADPAYDAPAPPQEYQFGGEGDHFL